MSADTPETPPQNASADPDTSPNASATVPAEGAGAAAPLAKRPRAPRKTAVKATDGDAAIGAALAATGELFPAEGDAPLVAPAPAAPRKRARKVAEASEPTPPSSGGDEPSAAPSAVPMTVMQVDPVAKALPADLEAPAGSADPAESTAPADAVSEASSADVEGRRSRSRRRRRGRRGGADEPVDGVVRADGDSSDGDDADAPGVPDDGAQATGGAQSDEARPPRGDRPPRPEREPRAAAPGVAFSTADVSDTFAGVLSGDFDIEGEVVEEAPDASGKRVLAAEPDAPKLHKVLAQSGIGSRRDMEQLITDGKVTVNGEVAHTGQRISFGDEVRVAGRVVKLRIAPPPARVIAYHKPAGEVVTMDDPQQRPTVFRRLPRLQHGKWQSVGRLDINTEGLLLFTNSGDLANKLMHPRFGVEREYAVRVLGTLEQESREKLLAGVSIDGQVAQFKSIEDGGGEGANRWYRVVITEGRNREVRKLFDAVGMAVSRLIRIRYGSVVLPKGLRRAVWVDLDDNDVRRLRQLAGADSSQRGGAPRDDAPRDNAPRDNAPREGAPRNNAPRNERGPRPENGPRTTEPATAWAA